MTAIKNCDICGTEFVRPYRYSHAMWDRRRFCSVLCRNRGIRHEKTEITYGQAHRRVAKTFGRAGDRTCVDCGTQATEYAFNHSDGPMVRVDPFGRAYSLDVNDYQPVCRSCHRRRDRSNLCRNGLHEMTPENRWKDTNACIECRRETFRRAARTRAAKAKGMVNA